MRSSAGSVWVSKMKYIDSHAHIFSSEYNEDFEEMLARTEERGVERIMIVTTEPEEARRAIAFAKQDPYRFQVAYGIHPEDVTKASEERLQEMEEIRIKSLPRKRDNEPVNINCNIDDLIMTSMNQNFVPVIDDNRIFIGIVTRKSIIGYCYNQCKQLKSLE